MSKFDPKKKEELDAAMWVYEQVFPKFIGTSYDKDVLFDIIPMDVTYDVDGVSPAFTADTRAWMPIFYENYREKNEYLALWHMAHPDEKNLPAKPSVEEVTKAEKNKEANPAKYEEVMGRLRLHKAKWTDSTKGQVSTKGEKKKCSWPYEARKLYKTLKKEVEAHMATNKAQMRKVEKAVLAALKEREKEAAEKEGASRATKRAKKAAQAEQDEDEDDCASGLEDFVDSDKE